MTEVSRSSSVVRVKPEADIYTLLVIVAILALGTTVGVAIWNLTSTYGLKFAEIFQPL